jgi:Protein of unknown function (DUF1761)
MTDVNEIAVIVSALLALALGSIWYSPLVFGKHWQKAAGLSDADLVLTPNALMRALLIAFVSNAIVLFVLAHVVRFAGVYAIPYTQLILGVVLLLGASIGSMVVWEKRSSIYFLIHTGYAALVVALGTAVIAYWPW